MKREANKQKRFVCMAFHHKEHGFTFISLLCSLSILAFTIPLISYTLQTAKTTSHYDQLSVYQFFQFLRNEAIRSSQYIIDEPYSIELIQNNERITIKQHGDVIHRQVNGKGHEVYLFNIQSVIFIQNSHGFRVQITNKSGEIYEKTIILYP